MTPDPKLAEVAGKAANRLHHLSMRYSGALIELVAQRPIGFVAQGHPGLREARDLIDLILLTRAEINGLTKVLVDLQLVDVDKLNEIFAGEYEWFAQTKAFFLGVRVTDAGIEIDAASAASAETQP